jgi:apolipoprotein N-acyltransferase
MPEGAGFFILLPLIWLAVAWIEVAPVPKPDGRIEVGLVQGSFPQSLKWTVPLNEAVSRYVEETESLIARNRADLILWPEVALPVVLSEEPKLLEYLIRQVRDWRVPLLFGVLDRDFRLGPEGPLYNSAVLLDPWTTQGTEPPTTPLQVSQMLRGDSVPLTESRLLPSVFALPPSSQIRVYDKARLLPFGEYVPFASVLTFVQKFVENRGGGAFSPGPPGAVLDTRFGEIGPLICFESTHAALARKAVLAGAVVLVNITNDAWFLQTAAMRQHALQCRFRAVETGRAVVRSANTGITAVYLPSGEEVSRLPVWTQTSNIATVPLYSHLTFQARVGDFFGWLCLACLLFSLWLSTGEARDDEEAAEEE